MATTARNEDLRKALRDAASLGRVAEGAARSERARALVRMREHESRAEACSDRAADLRLRASILGYVPGLGFARRASESAAKAARIEAAEAREAGTSERERAERLSGLVRRIVAAREKTSRASAGVHVLIVADRDLTSRIRSAGNRLQYVRRSRPAGEDQDGSWVVESLSVISEALKAVSDLAKATDRARRAQATEQVRQAEGQRVPSASRLYLPIPRTMDAMAAKAGALRDANAPRGSSAWFVPHGTPLGPLRNMLPLAARPVPAGLSFPPVPMRAAGQNLWGFLDPDSWGHVRRQAYESSGRRCMVCGGRSEGFLAERLYKEEERRHPIECHEVWDWKVPRESDGIGIQTLKQMLVVCRNCHPIFHSQFFMRRAQALGIADQVADAIEKRRMVVNRETRAQVNAGIEAGAELMRRASGVDTWVVDLGHLAGQGYMATHTPIVVEGNAASLPPERIAGIAFETDEGRSFPARSAGDIHEALLRGIATSTSEVVRFPGR